MAEPARRPGAFHDREATEEALRSAAVELLHSEGVLSGLNLREVADRAGVNRGLVYQYFGSRRALLRSALWSKARENAADMAGGDALPLRRRLSHLFWSSLRLPEPIRLNALLLLDGDDRPKPIARRAQGRARLAEEAARGELPSDDVDAVQATLAAAIHGYALLREAMARQIDVPVEELDARVARCLEDLFARDGDAPGA